MGLPPGPAVRAGGGRVVGPVGHRPGRPPGVPAATGGDEAGRGTVCGESSTSGVGRAFGRATLTNPLSGDALTGSGGGEGTPRAVGSVSGGIGRWRQRVTTHVKPGGLSTEVSTRRRNRRSLRHIDGFVARTTWRAGAPCPGPTAPRPVRPARRSGRPAARWTGRGTRVATRWRSSGFPARSPSVVPGTHR